MRIRMMKTPSLLTRSFARRLSTTFMFCFSRNYKKLMMPGVCQIVSVVREQTPQYVGHSKLAVTWMLLF